MAKRREAPPRQRRGKLSARLPITEDHLRELLTRRTLARGHWQRLTRTFDRHRGPFAILHEPGLELPRGPIAHPFLAALHRLRHGGEILAAAPPPGAGRARPAARPRQAEAGYREAEQGLPAAADPFLRLMLLQEAAAAVVNGMIENLDWSGLQLAQEVAKEPSPERAAELAAYTVAMLDDHRAEIQRAGELLAAAAPLLAQHGNPEQRLRQSWLSAHTRQWADPGGAVLTLIETFEQAQARGREAWLAPMATDLVLLLPRLRTLEVETRWTIMKRFQPLAIWLLAFFDRISARAIEAPLSEPAIRLPADSEASVPAD